MKHASIIYRRRSSGSMLILISITILLIVAVFMLCVTLNNLMFHRSRCQQSSDGLVMELASNINSNDRVGQINEMEARSRELVFETRKQLSDCPAHELTHLLPLCHKFMVEAREGHHLIDQERKNQIQIVCDALCAEADRRNKESQEQTPWMFAGLSGKPSVIKRVEVGRVANVETNVPGTPILESLWEHDKRSGYLQPGSNLFRAGVNAKLPGEDADLDFLLSGLPACVQGSCTAPRNVNSDVFIPFGIIYENGKKRNFSFPHLPNAIRVLSVLDAEVGGNQKTSVQIYSVGASSGALASVD